MGPADVRGGYQAMVAGQGDRRPHVEGAPATHTAAGGLAGTGAVGDTLPSSSHVSHAGEGRPASPQSGPRQSAP